MAYSEWHRIQFTIERIQIQLAFTNNVAAIISSKFIIKYDKYGYWTGFVR